MKKNFFRCIFDIASELAILSNGPISSGPFHITAALLLCNHMRKKTIFLMHSKWIEHTAFI